MKGRGKVKARQNTMYQAGILLAVVVLLGASNVPAQEPIWDFLPPEATIIPGHFGPIEKKGLDFAIDYLATLHAEVEKAVQNGWSLAKTVEHVKMEDFRGYAIFDGCGFFATTPPTLVFQSPSQPCFVIRIVLQRRVARVPEPWASLKIWPDDCVDTPGFRGSPSTHQNRH